MVFDQVGLFGGSVDIPSEPEAKSSLLASGEQTIVGEDLMEGTSKGNSFPETREAAAGKASFVGIHTNISPECKSGMRARTSSGGTWVTEANMFLQGRSPVRWLVQLRRNAASSHFRDQTRFPHTWRA